MTSFTSHNHKRVLSLKINDKKAKKTLTKLSCNTVKTSEMEGGLRYLDLFTLSYH